MVVQPFKIEALNIAADLLDLSPHARERRLALRYIERQSAHQEHEELVPL